MTSSVSVILSDDTQQQIEKLAGTRKIPPEKLLAEVIENYVAHEEWRDAAWRDADAAWENFLATGLHATGEEVDAWLAKLEAGEDAEPPECHG